MPGIPGIVCTFGQCYFISLSPAVKSENIHPHTVPLKSFQHNSALQIRIDMRKPAAISPTPAIRLNAVGGTGIGTEGKNNFSGRFQAGKFKGIIIAAALSTGIKLIYITA